MGKSRSKSRNDAPSTKKALTGRRSPSAGRNTKQPELKNTEQKGADYLKQQVRAPVSATTFGLEFEFIVAFKQKVLESILSRYNIEADIIKSFTDNEHRNLLGEFTSHYDTNSSHNCRLRYPSWALHVPQNDTVCQNGLHHGQYINKASGARLWMRRYVMEPLLMVKECLQKAGLQCNVIGRVEPDPNNLHDPEKAEIPFSGEDKSVMFRKSTVDYTHWTLTNDHTLIGVLQSQLQEHLKSKGVEEKEVRNWDSSGVELISPVFDLEDKAGAFQQVREYLGSLTGKDMSTLESVWASTHVHIGLDFDKAEDMPMLLLQHLAYILVLHEDLISKCHPRSRSGVQLPPSSPAEPPLEFLDDEEYDPDNYEPPPSPTEEEKEQENEDQVLRVEAEYTGVDNISSNARYLRQQLPSHSPRHQLRHIRDKLFQEDGNIFDLVELLQRPQNPKDIHGDRNRGYMYNFANLWALAKGETPWKPIKPTIEFRQHACTLDVEVVRHWVTLLEAIVKVAAKKAAQSTQHNNLTALDPTRSFAEREASKYPVLSSSSLPWPCETMNDFCIRFLGLDDEEGYYWQARYEQFKDDRPHQT